MTVTGWGALWSPFDKDVAALMPDVGEGKEMSEKVNFPLKLREVEIEAMDNDTCNAVFAADKLSVAETEICAMYQGSTKASCQGDSGGPLVVATPFGLHPGGRGELGHDLRQYRHAKRFRPRVVLQRLDQRNDEEQLTLKAHAEPVPLSQAWALRLACSSP